MTQDRNNDQHESMLDSNEFSRQYGDAVTDVEIAISISSTPSAIELAVAGLSQVYLNHPDHRAQMITIQDF